MSVFVPIALVIAVLAMLIGPQIEGYGGNLTGFITFGSLFSPAIHPPSGAIVGSIAGYDGQFFYLQALDPLLLHGSTVTAMKATASAYRLQRMAYPLLAYVLAGGRASAIPASMLAVNLIVLLAFSTGIAIYLAGRGWSTLWAVPLTLMPGMLLPAMRDLSDPLATATLVAGMLSIRHERRWWAAAGLTVSVLTREVMVAPILGAAAWFALQAWQRRAHGGWRHVLIRAWPPIVLPLVAFAGWQAYVTYRIGGLPGGPLTTFPFWNFVQEIRGSVRELPPLEAAWDTVYVLLMFAVVFVAAVRAARRRSLLALAAAALSIPIVVAALGDPWGDARLTAPVFALLLLDGLEHRDRVAVGVSCAAAAMMIPALFVIPGVV